MLTDRIRRYKRRKPAALVALFLANASIIATLVLIRRASV
jgi:hypothetical protein